MPYTLIPPGKRKNKYWYALITVPGHRTERSLRTKDKKQAAKEAARIEREVWDEHVNGATHETVSHAIDRYIMFRRPRPADEQDLINIGAMIGDVPLHEVSQKHFDDCAINLYPNASPQTRNRSVYTPLQAALRHSGVNILLRRPKQPRPRHRSLTADQRDKFIAATDDADLRALLCLMFFTGCRISEAISLTWAQVDMQAESALIDMGKTDHEEWVPLHTRVIAALKELPKARIKVLRWKTKSGPRKPLAALSKATGIKFNPHMARHTFGDLMMESGASLRDLMEAGRWSDAKSAMRYTGRKQDRLRARIEAL